METGFTLDTDGNEGMANDDGILYRPSNSSLKDDDSDNELLEKNRARQNFRRIGSSVRYHENDKFSKVKPGCLSSELRKALGISRHDIPLHIYRMRSMGYPPGWLRKAKVEQLPFFEKGGDLCSSQEASYNEDALISYPGFNVYSSKLLEKCHEFNCPRIQRADLLENFVASLNKSSKSSDLSRYKKSLENKDLCDLEGERQRILSEINALKSALPSDQNLSGGGEEINNTVDPMDVPIDRPFSNLTPESGIDTDPRKNLGQEESPIDDRCANLYTVGKTLNPTASISVETPKEQVDLVSIESTTIPPAGSLGDLASVTESADSVQTASKLPSLDAFSSGIQPYVPFENLPNAQGGYNRVRDLLKRLKGNSDISNLSIIKNEGSIPKSPEPVDSSFQTHLPESNSQNTLSNSRALCSSPRVDHRSRRINEDNYEVSNEVDHHHTHGRIYRRESSRPNGVECRGYRSAPSRFYARGNYVAPYPYRNFRSELFPTYEYPRGQHGSHGSYSGHSCARRSNEYY